MKVITRLSAEAFLARPETTTPMQLLEGILVVSPTPIPIHQKILGVAEYWLIDPSARYVELWHLEAGRFVRLGGDGSGESFFSPVLNHTASLAGIV